VTILLLDIPGLHLAYLGCYGNDWVATPNLDRLAGDAVVFDGHFAGTPGDLRSGRYCFPDASERTPSVYAGGLLHFIHAGDASLSLDERFTLVAKNILAALKKKPRPEKQLIWAEFPSLAPPWNLSADMLDAYFDEEADPDDDETDEPPAEQSKVPLEPWPDPPMKLPAGDEHFDRLQFTYAAVVTFVDAQIGWLIDKLRGKLLDELLLVITSSAALPLAEHGWVGRQRAWQHEENVHLPLLLRLPKAEHGGLRIGALTQSVDLLPTLLEYLGLSEKLPGRSLWPLIRHEAAEIRPCACSGDRIGGSAEWALRTPEWAYLLPLSNSEGDPPRSPRLYVKPDDRWEVNDVYAHHPELVEQLDKTLRQFVASTLL
jgi:arylsulfatase A-like enzyme